MRRVAATLALLAALAVPGSSSSEPSPTGIKGRVTDVTCYGPCVDGGRPYRNEAKVIVERRRSGRVVRRASITGPDFRVRVGAGRYRVRLRPIVSGSRRGCWRGSSSRARVRKAELTAVELTAENICIRRPGAGT